MIIAMMACDIIVGMTFVNTLWVFLVKGTSAFADEEPTRETREITLPQPTSKIQIEENVPLDLAYVASVHGMTANEIAPLAAKACPPKVRAANNASEYDAVKKTDAGLKQKSAETRNDARSISGCFRSSSDCRSSKPVMS